MYGVINPIYKYVAAAEAETAVAKENVSVAALHSLIPALYDYKCKADALDDASGADRKCLVDVVRYKLLV